MYRISQACEKAFSQLPVVKYSDEWHCSLEEELCNSVCILSVLTMRFNMSVIVILNMNKHIIFIHITKMCSFDLQDV